MNGSRDSAARFRGRRKPFRCPCDDCQASLELTGFCVAHVERLSRVRDEYVRENSRMGNRLKIRVVEVDDDELEDAA